MSLFKKPKKAVQQSRRLFTSEVENIDVDEEDRVEAEIKQKKKEKKEKDKSSKPQKSSLLSFGDEEDEGETFQVKKSSFSRRIHKERKKNKSNDKSDKNISKNSQNSNSHHDNNSYPPTSHVTKDSTNFVKEIQSDDGFSIRLKNSNPENLILNGRAALCAGRDDMSSEEENDENEPEERAVGHRFSQPEEFDFKLESGAIPDAAMIHAARKRRQKAREQGEFIALEEKDQEELKKGKRNIREEDEAEDGSSGEEQRVDMSGIKGIKEKEERREQFYSAQPQGSEDDSDVEMNEWENQQIRKGVTGAQLISAHQESSFNQYMIQSFSNNFNNLNSNDEPKLTTAELIEQAYSQTNSEVGKRLRKEKKKEPTKTSGIKAPQEISKAINDKLKASREQNHKNFVEIDRITDEFKSIKIDLKDCEQNGPVAAAKYRFYQELKLYFEDLIECLNEKLPIISALEEKSINVMGKYSKKLIERRRQDVRDQAKELTDTKYFGKKTPEDEERVRRAAEREGRRNRRRRDREKLNMNETHNDGMSSDDEVPDVELAQYREQLAQIKLDASMIFDEVVEEYCELPHILMKFDEWKKKDLSAYKEAYVHLCLPKVVSIFVRAQMILWNPFELDHYEDVDQMKWFHPLAMYGCSSMDNEDSLRKDPDVFAIPTVIEKVILLKLSKLIDECWDPMSTVQTLKLVKLMNQLSNDYPSLRITSKNLQAMFTIITDKMKIALDNDVFIPIFQKQNADAKSSFFQRQFYSGVKLFRNFISFQGIVADKVLKNYAISSLLNRYLLSAMRVSLPADGVTKAYTLVLTLPRVWLVSADKSFIESINMFVMYVTSLESQLDRKSPMYIDSIEKLKQISNRLDLMVAK